MKVKICFFRKSISLLFLLFITLNIFVTANVWSAELIVVTVDHKKIDADLEDFPVMLKLDDSNVPNFIDRIVSNPDNTLKFKVEDGTGSQCYVEKELWDYNARSVILHVKVPLVSSTVDTALTLIHDETIPDNTAYIGEAGSPAAQKVWDKFFTHVLHLAEIGHGTDNEYRDSTVKGNHGTGVKPPSRVDALIGYGQLFGAMSEDNYIQVDGADPDGGTEVTLEAVFKPDAGALSGKRHIIQNPGTGSNTSITIRHGAYLETWVYTGSSANAMGTTPLEGGIWYYGAGRWKSGEPASVWLNDAQESVGTERTGTIGRGAADKFEIGNWHGVSKREFENGVADEIRISNIKRSDAWLKATYHSLFNTLVAYRSGPDSDSDGLLDSDETDIYGTDPFVADTDGDGIDDGAERGYWNTDWNTDTDDDGIISLLDSDSDNDRVQDGDEIDQGFDPADQNSYPPQVLSVITTTIDHNKIDADLFDFPVTLKLDDSNAWDFFERIVSNPANALKFRVEDSTGSQCYIEKELWDNANRMVILHVKAPFVSSSEDTVLNLLYDETMVDHDTHIGDIDSRPAQNAWDPYFTHVLHLSESGNGTDKEYRDSTARGNHGTGVIAPDRVAAPTGYGQSFGLKSDGEYIQVDGSDPDGSTEITLEAMFKPDAGSLSKYRHILQNPGKGQNASLFLRHGKYFESWMYIGGATKAVGTTPLVGGTWYYGAGRWKSGEPVSAWLNDTREAASAEKSGTIGRGVRDRYEIGNWHSKSGMEFENGAADEIRISSIKRSDAWLKATYHSLFNNLVDYEFGPDYDGDGILDNDEIDIYGTDPYNADSDADGINDGAELAYWGEEWDADADGDGLINLLDPDSDNDGLLDGEEIDQGFDPADPGHFPLPGPGYRDVDYGLDDNEQQGGGGIISETVRLLNGNMLEHRTDVSFSSPHRMGLSFNAYYNSRSGSLGDLGYGWTHSYEAYLDTRFRISGQTYLKIVDETRRAHLFRLKSPGVYTGAFTEKSYVKTEDGSFVWYCLDGSRYGFSTRGRLIWIDDVVGNRITVQYDAEGLLDAVRDITSGRKLRFHYIDGLLEYIEGPATEPVPGGKWVSYGYDANRNLTSVTYADGSGFDYNYNDTYQIHNLTGKKNKLGQRLNTWSYDQFDRCTSTSNRQGQGVSIRYVTDNQIEVTDDYGVLRTYTIAEINGRRRVAAMQGAADPPYSAGYAVSWTYDNDLNLTEVEYANSTVNQYQDYDTKGNPGTSILAAGKSEERIITWTYHPDMSVPLTRTEPSVLGDGDKVTIWDYDDDHDAAPNENPTGLITRIVQQGYTKNISGQTVSYEYVTTFAYNEYGQVLTIDGPRTDISDLTSFEYDSTTGNLNTITRALIGDTYLPESDYNAAGQAGKIIDVNGQATRFTYDGRGRIIAVHHDADGSAQTVTYNDAGLPDNSIDEDGIEKGYEYDDTYGHLYRRYDPENNYIQYLYDGQGNLVEKSKHVENGDRYSRHRWNYKSPDIKGKLWKKIRFDDTFTEYRYFADGNLKSKTDPENRTSRYGYDAFNRLKKIKQTHKSEWDTITSYSYNMHGNLESVTDAGDHRTTYTYDDMGRVVITTLVDTGTTTYAYDKAGNLVQKTDANGVTTHYSYDALNRLTVIDFPTDVDITYSYDEGPNGMGRRTGMTDASGSTTFVYDSRGRLVDKISTVLGQAYTVTRGFSKAGRQIFLRYPPDIEGRRLDYIRDGVTGRIKKVSTIYHSLKITLLDKLAFYPFGAPRTARHWGARSSSGGGGGGGHATKGHPIEIEKSDCGCIEVINRGKPMEQSYTYYADGNIKSITAYRTPWFSQDFQYNSLGHLTQSDNFFNVIDYTYDKVGNRLTRTIDNQAETYSYYPGTNRLQSVTGTGTVNYTYDNNGNPTGIGNRSYVYNQSNRLTEVTQGGNTVAEYTYNALGQRVLKEASGVSTVFHYDFDGKIIAESLPDGTITKHYMYMGQNRLSRYDVAKEEFAFYANNHLGTPLIMAKYKNATGPVLWQADYKPFGEAEVSTNSTEINNFRFPGQYYDEDTGLHYNYHRFYDPKTGRYLTPDPIGQLGGINLYTYVLNNPINVIDPYGLKNWGQIISGGILVIKGRAILGVGITVITIGVVKAAAGDEMVLAPHTIGVGGLLAGAGILTGVYGVELIIEGWNESDNQCE